MWLNYHIIFQHLNLLSPTLRQFSLVKKCLSSNSRVPLQLHLKAPLEDLNPRAVVIEMTAMLFVDAVMGQSGRDSSSNPDKGLQSFPKSNYDHNGRTAVCLVTIKEKWVINVLQLFCMRWEKDSAFRPSIRGIMSNPITTDIILNGDKQSRHRHNTMITHSYYVGTIRTKMNKNRGQRIKYT